MAAGCDEVGLSDTTGYADPAAVKRHDRAGARCGREQPALTGIHLHNTRGLGLANALMALECGLSDARFASLGGLGGCPFAPGASGNIVTEDLCFMLAAMGLRHRHRSGCALVAVRSILSDALPGEPLYGFLPDAGLPLGWKDAAMTIVGTKMVSDGKTAQATVR